MTQDEIIEMARPRAWYGKVEGWTFNSYEELEAFAKLVAEKEREAWSKVCEDIRKVFNEKADLAYIAGQKEEREACAKVADKYADGLERNYSEIIADEIRARGKG